MPKKKEKKVLVSSSFLSEFDKLQKKVQRMEELEKHVAEAKEKEAETESLQNALNTFQSEYEEMKAQNKLEVERRVKASLQQDKLKDRLRATEKSSNNYKINAKRLENAKREVSKNYARAKKKVDVLSIDFAYI